jgi:hypothetical protein
MAAVLSYAAVYFMSWVITNNPNENGLTLLAYPVYYLGALYPAFLLSSRTGYAHLLVGLKTSVYGWLFSGFSLWVITGTTSFIFLVLLLICIILGGFSGSYVALRRQLRKEAIEEFEEPSNTFET